MATLEEVAHTAVNGTDQELPAQEDPVEETPDRRHVDALLDMSEEEFLKDLEPYEYHCYPGWDEAVHGWARVAPLSCILLNQKRDSKPIRPKTKKNKEADNPQHMGSWSNTAVAALQINTSEWPVQNAMEKTTSNLSLEEKTEEKGMLRETPVQNRPTKPRKHSQMPNSTVVPIKNFLPPIKSQHLNPQRVSVQLCSSKKVPEGETMEENCFMFDKKSGMRGIKVDPVANPELPTCSADLTSKYWTCQHNPHLFSALSLSIPKGYQVPMSSKPDTVHRTRYPMGKSLTQPLHSSSTAAGAQAHIRPSKTVYSLKLYEGCKINV